MAKAIKVEKLSKAYQLGDFGTGTISRDLERYFAKLRGKAEPFGRLEDENNRTNKAFSDITLSLNDVSFNVEQGDAVGLIGRNGAGKSTLLKILSRVTSPTSGTVKLKGRIASLLEVGTGFHPELTGSENVYLNGAILGMRKSEIKRKFDEIVSFAGIERYIDTPVKRYSSGMYVRLAFAVAAYLESEILVVDEVLAVGDAEFQKRCLGKMNSVTKNEGRTVLFVSHNMAAVETLCNKGIVLDNGMLVFDGNIKKSISYYVEQQQQKVLSGSISSYLASKKNPFIKLSSITVNGTTDINVPVTDSVKLSFQGTAFEPSAIDIELYLVDIQSNQKIYFCTLLYTQGKALNVNTGQFNLSFKVSLPENIVAGDYHLDINITKPNDQFLYQIHECITLLIGGSVSPSGKKFTMDDKLGYAFLGVSELNLKQID